jgi:peptidoglycan/xylan/chitin deacetylase (PgdA/CDA1 family)
MAPQTLPPLALAYHGVADVPLRRDLGGLFVRPGDLQRQIERLRQWGYRLVTFGELAQAAAQGRAAGLAALTFDDGLVDNHETLVPLLRAEGIPATVFVVSGWLGRTYPWGPWTRLMTADEVVDVHRAGVEIGAHTVTHPDLGTLSREGAFSELARSRADLAEILGAPVDVASYPFGVAGPDTLAACADAGFRAACRTSGEGSWAEPLNLPRQAMTNRGSMAALWLKRDDRYEPLMRYRPVRLARRLVRKVRATAG